VADAVAVSHTFAPFDPDGLAVSQIFLEELDLSTPNIYHFDVRAVRRPAGQVLVAGPSGTHAFTTPDFLVADLEAEFGEGTGLRVFVIEEDEVEEVELDDVELAERLLAPKEIETEEIPVIDVPPDPF